MLAKSWKKICLIILIIACLWNIISKLSYKVSFYQVVNNLQEKYKKEQITTKTKLRATLANRLKRRSEV